MTTRLRTTILCALCVVAVTIGLCSAEAAEKDLSFNRDIRPILSSKCFACHGFDAKKRQADRRLDTPDGAAEEHDGVRAVVPGNLTKSELWRRVTSTDDDEVMPPPTSNKKLTAGECELLKRWIEQGAPYQKHWAFEPIMRPPVPAGAKESLPIDAFLNQRIEQAGLTAPPPADRETLMRRVAFALTGLPPTLEDLDKFEGAYEAYVDKLLARPAMAKKWPGIGSTSPATPTRTDCTSITNGRCGPIATGWSRRLTTICRTTSSRSGKSRAICCRAQRRSSSSPPASIAAT
jgi:uncharacterized protein DUF1549/cytochrome c